QGSRPAQDPENRWSRRRSRPYNRTTVRDKGSSHCSRPRNPRVEPLLKTQKTDGRGAARDHITELPFGIKGRATAQDP
ncbi:unnamed protein product, partial [Musa textilis]